MNIIKPIDSIVAPIDFSKNSEFVAQSAAYIAGQFNAALHFVYVVQEFDYNAGFFSPEKSVADLETELFISATKKMEDFYNVNLPLLNKNCKEITTKVLAGDISEQIIGYASSLETGMIVMGTHGYKGLEKIMFGSVANKVVQNSHCPVLTVNPYKCNVTPK
ncbi:universal stress protein [Desulfotalea psychrophila]|uniref:UspA domain-containing protein n=1 Tax=Desulfotalea psychrophila (strain LSv54 / DSM 12343) TaxID=177439 RepID=Q6ARB3_DESPS|nr:universal stress protein [Desulfotalea psychrophila]CAG35111.1 conserved hypothetical protein [Desulfotalea psychrophila LSv54]